MIILIVSYDHDDLFLSFEFFNNLLLLDINILRDVYKLLLSTRLMLHFLNVVSLLIGWDDLIRLSSIDALTLFLVLLVVVLVIHLALGRLTN